jgi:hypothetical protein
MFSALTYHILLHVHVASSESLARMEELLRQGLRESNEARTEDGTESTATEAHAGTGGTDKEEFFDDDTTTKNDIGMTTMANGVDMSCGVRDCSVRLHPALFIFVYSESLCYSMFCRRTIMINAIIALLIPNQKSSVTVSPIWVLVMMNTRVMF